MLLYLHVNFSTPKAIALLILYLNVHIFYIGSVVLSALSTLSSWLLFFTILFCIHVFMSENVLKYVTEVHSETASHLIC